MAKVQSSNLGYPRLGEKREWKKALENYWNHKISEEQLLSETKELRLQALKKQQDKGIDLIPVGDFSFYDHILDTSITFGIVPKRFNYEAGKVDLDTYFEVARGNDGAVASEMTKWFNTNYHYIVPELVDAKPQLTENRALFYYEEAKKELGIDGKPVLVGPITYLKLAKGNDDFKGLLDQLVPLYGQILKELQDAGAKWVQIDEPYLATSFDKEELALFEEVYASFKNVAPDLKIELQTYFESLDYFEEVVKLPVDAIGVDFVHDHGESIEALEKFGFPEDKILAAGVIDGRNVWRADLDAKLGLLERIAKVVPKERLIVQPSSSLLHVPVTKASEPDLDGVLLGGLSFADEKLVELVALTEALNGEDVTAEFTDARAALGAINGSHHRNNAEVQEAIRNLENVEVKRDLPFAERIKLQHEWLQLPLLPTTTIGSFPQSPEVRKKRSDWLKKVITDAEYEKFIETETERWIRIQEDLDLDVLVHGEFERTDMVEYFGQKLDGFQATKFGWVQSYGSRAVRPPLVYGDVAFTEAITVKESVYAQSLTDRPVKGMLTAPVTIINWSFVRDDVPDYVVANQVGLALRKEVEALEEAGIRVIQVDEPALREGLPLKRSRWQKYLDDAVYSFKLTTTSVKNDTQIHTHMCYAEFEDIIDTISALDADVISIETSRSHGEIIETFEKVGYDKEIGLGVYDIHSPRVPTTGEIQENIRRALKVIDARQFWVNPDCGLKTRKEKETVEALRDMVNATKEIREAYKVIK
ncbi:5-methyltetrahydropteroyltriglutamate--homocysteine S-methyltransferase [Listeria newyorkensis]|uniref:5-methyltetrahydropteroyltriglutamate--homocysteine methyltransferase n=1 Tax=Listeria newyorkensis TaxID=1497681 RepID=A0ABX4XLZ4_9LIST|nr:5-methyltetrahydropteroyltriglutamate--homocysteine S-methyltransferase [Listeria newyorkensis]KGL46573.1 5-methyltetrahydropteroyltriglutamate--homocysteine methyltransferase [Listeria newyorkensis]PNP91083.1 5-methyltetrahydropteroyltriglutamate--homocysteine S-methyltransferase [Listeria newyorkensis]WAO20832.1 5-methyltetrahydropteroyltriglutamate--homocysteine S-methyltransferase [Listeria newyorkensis]SQC56323.1 5-methyltetrahydropteroyltriglutamate--homocysteine methyltransferase [Lis